MFCRISDQMQKGYQCRREPIQTEEVSFNGDEILALLRFQLLIWGLNLIQDIYLENRLSCTVNKQKVEQSSSEFVQLVLARLLRECETH